MIFLSVYHLGFRIINASAIPFKYGGGLSSLSLRIFPMWEKAVSRNRRVVKTCVG